MRSVIERSGKGSRTAAFFQAYGVFTAFAGIVATVVVVTTNRMTARLAWTALGVLLASSVWSALVWGVGVVLEDVIELRGRLGDPRVPPAERERSPQETAEGSRRPDGGGER